jgi:hypothetical protein
MVKPVGGGTCSGTCSYGRLEHGAAGMFFIFLNLKEPAVFNVYRYLAMVMAPHAYRLFNLRLTHFYPPF